MSHHIKQCARHFHCLAFLRACSKPHTQRCVTQARLEAQESLAKTREEADAAVQAAELQALKAQEEAQNAHAAAQSAASSAEHWKSRCESAK